MAEEQEMSMNEILSSIRQILSDETQPDNEKLDEEMEDVFVLTPAMRCPDVSTQDIQQKMKLVLNKLAEQKAILSPQEYQTFVNTEIRPVLTEWMNNMVPTLVQNAVDAEIKKLLG